MFSVNLLKLRKIVFLLILASVLFASALSPAHQNASVNPATSTPPSSLAPASTTPDFTISPSPSTFTMTPGGLSKTSTITLTSLGGFSGSVYLSSFAFAAVGSLNPSIVQLSATTITATSTLTISVPSDALPFNDTVFVEGVGGCSLSHIASISVQVVAPDFAISASKIQMTITPGGSDTSTIAVASKNGFAGTVTLSAPSELPSALNPTSITITSGQTLTSTLTVLVPVDTDPGNYTATVFGESGNLLPDSVDITITVPGPGFALTANTDYLTLVPGGPSNSSMITVTPSGGFSDLVDFSLDSSPTGLTTILDPFSISVPTATSSTLTVSAASGTPPGFYSVQVAGTSGHLTDSVSITVKVKGPQPPSFEVIPDPSFLFLLPGSSSCMSTLTGISFGGFTGTVGLVIVNKDGLTASLSAPSITIPVAPTSILTVSAPANTKPGSYSVEINATSNTLAKFHLVFVSVEVIGPFFDLSSNPTSLSIAANTSGSSTISLSAESGLSQTDTVTLTVKSLNPNFTPMLSPSSISGSQTSTLSVSASLITPPGFYFDAINITGTFGTVVRHLFISIIVKGDFSLSASSTLLSVGERTDATSSISIGSIDGFAKPVLLFASPSSPNLNATVQPSFVLGSGTAVLHVNSTIPGIYTVDIFASSGFLFHETSVVVTITGPDFTLSASPPSLTIVAGSSQTSTIAISTGNGFASEVALSTSTPQGITANPSPAVILPGQSSVLTITVDVLMTPGSYVVDVLGSNGSLTHDLRITVNVAGFIVRASPDTITVAQGTSQSTTVQAASLNGFAGTKKLTTVASLGLTPTPTSTDVTTVSGVFQLNIAASNSLAPGSYNANVTGVSGSLSQNTTITIIVSLAKPDFTVSVGIVSPASIDVGSSGTSTVTVHSLNGFSGTVSLTVNAPTGLTCSPLNPVSLPPDKTPTLSCTSTTATDYSVSVTGAGNGLTRFSNSVTFHFVDFSLSATPTSITTPAGTAGTSTILVNALNGFTITTVSLAVTAPVPPPTGCNISLNLEVLSVNCTAPTATFTVTVTGTDNTLQRHVDVPVTVTSPPDFSLSIGTVSPGAIHVGSPGTATITVHGLNGFSGTITLTINGPAMLTCLSLGSVTLPPDQTPTLSCSSTSAGDYQVSIKGVGNGLTRTSNTVTFHIADFSLSANPTSITTAVSVEGTSTISVNPINGFSDSVSLAVTSPIPQYCTAIAQAITLSATCSIINSFIVTVTGTSGTLHRTVDVPVTVTNAPNFAVNVGTVSPAAIDVGSSGAASVTVGGMNSFSGSVSLTVNAPAGLSCGALGSVTPDATRTLSCSSSAAADYSVTVTGVGNGLTRTSNTVTFHFVDFSVSANPTSVGPITAGVQDKTATITVSALNGFLGTVQLTTNPSPGLTATVNPTSVPASGTSTLTVSATTGGIYTLTVTGRSDPLSHTTMTITVTVADFTITASSPNTVGTAQSASSTITITNQHGFTGTVALSDTPLPSGLTCTPTSLPSIIVPSSTTTTILSCTSATAGTFTVTVTGTSSSLSHHVSGTFTYATPDITLTASTSSLSFDSGSYTTATVTIRPQYGFSGTITLGVNEPSGVTCNLDHQTVQTSGTATLTCNSTTPGDYTVTVTASGGATPHQAAFAVHVASVISPAPPAPTILGLPPILFYSIVAAIIAIIAIAGVTIIIRSRKP